MELEVRTCEGDEDERAAADTLMDTCRQLVARYRRELGTTRSTALRAQLLGNGHGASSAVPLLNGEAAAAAAAADGEPGADAATVSRGQRLQAGADGDGAPRCGYSDGSRGSGADAGKVARSTPGHRRPIADWSRPYLCHGAHRACTALAVYRANRCGHFGAGGGAGATLLAGKQTGGIESVYRVVGGERGVATGGALLAFAVGTLAGARWVSCRSRMRLHRLVDTTMMFAGRDVDDKRGHRAGRLCHSTSAGCCVSTADATYRYAFWRRRTRPPPASRRRQTLRRGRRRYRALSPARECGARWPSGLPVRTAPPQRIHQGTEHFLQTCRGPRAAASILVREVSLRCALAVSPICADGAVTHASAATDSQRALPACVCDGADELAMRELGAATAGARCEMLGYVAAPVHRLPGVAGGRRALSTCWMAGRPRDLSAFWGALLPQRRARILPRSVNATGLQMAATHPDAPAAKMPGDGPEKTEDGAAASGRRRLGGSHRLVPPHRQSGSAGAPGGAGRVVEERCGAPDRGVPVGDRGGVAVDVQPLRGVPGVQRHQAGHLGSDALSEPAERHPAAGAASEPVHAHQR
eukprot:ctg_190.g151